MAVVLKQGGKPIGQLTDEGKFVDASGNEHDVVTDGGNIATSLTPGQVKDEGEKLEVPLFTTGPPNVPMQNVEPPAGEPKTEEVEPLEGMALENALLKRQIEALSQTPHQHNVPGTQPTPPTNIEVNLEDLDAIPDNIDPKEDPYGVAQTLKNVTKALGKIVPIVGRLDQHAGYQEAMKSLDSEKLAEGNKEIYSDKKLGPIAERLLNAELSTNRTDTLPVIVNKIALEVKALGVEGEKNTLTKKVSQLRKVPGTLRNTDGAMPSVTVDKPKSVADARNAYQAWRRARGRFNSGG